MIACDKCSGMPAACRKAPSGVVVANHVRSAASDAKPASGMFGGHRASEEKNGSLLVIVKFDGGL